MPNLGSERANKGNKHRIKLIVDREISFPVIRVHLDKVDYIFGYIYCKSKRFLSLLLLLLFYYLHP